MANWHIYGDGKVIISGLGCSTALLKNIAMSYHIVAQMCHLVIKVVVMIVYILCTPVTIHTHIQTYIHIYVCTLVCTCLCTCVCIWAYMCVTGIEIGIQNLCSGLCRDEWWGWVGDVCRCTGKLAWLYCTYTRAFPTQMRQQTIKTSFHDITVILLM